MSILIKLFPLILLPIIMLIFLLSAALSESRVYDEITHVNAGYEFVVHHDFRFDPFNPPFARELIALPAILNKNAVFSDLTLFWPRFVVITFTLGLGFLVYLFSKKLYGKSGALLALFLFILEPNILANGHYAQSDIIFTFFYILTIYTYYEWQNSFTPRKIIVFGILIGLLLSTKTTALLFLFFPLTILLIKKYHFKNLLNITSIKHKLLFALLFFVSCSLSLWGTYFFKFEPLPGNRFDANRPAIKIAQYDNLVKFALNQPFPLGSYISSIKQQFVYNYSGLYRRDSMIMGNISHNGHSGYYFIPLIFIKTPFPLLILFFTTLFIFRKRVVSDSILLIPIISIIILVIATNATIVYRYILPVIPLIIIYSSQTVLLKTKHNYFKVIALSVVIAWYMIESISSFPHFISYINLTLGGYKKGYSYVFDSNYDWGQGLIKLKQYQDNNPKQKLQLAYFGDTSPSAYGISYERLRNYHSSTDGKPHHELKISKNTTVAISGTCWYLCGYYDNPKLKNKRPTEIIG